MKSTPVVANNFIRNRIEAERAALSADELASHNVVTRFPPEPNGFLHIGHAKSICLNFGIAEHFAGACNLRFDDTNPEKEEQIYIDAIQRDVCWLGYHWQEPIRFASSYFDTLYNCAEELIRKNKAYVCSLSAEQASEYRGSLTAPGKNSPYRERSVEENLELFARMRAGEIPAGAHVLRAKIDMASPNINLRDPMLYRIRHASHHQTGDKWCIYPLYDFTHPISDALEGVTHSLCTLEFEDHRPLYDWVLDNLSLPARPVQTEFSRLNLNYTITSKRKLKQLVDENVVAGWDDPRLPTIAGMRRRGYTPQSLRQFCEAIGVNKSEGVVDMAMLEHAIREDLNERSPRAMCVLKPIKLTLSNYPDDKAEALVLPRHPQREELGNRKVGWSKHLYIDVNDFAIEPPKKWKRLSPGAAVRLRGGYVVVCEDYKVDDAGHVVEVMARYDENTLGKNPEGYKAKGVIHWVDQQSAMPATVRLYDRLFQHESPDKGGQDFLVHLNPDSLIELHGCKIERSIWEDAQKGGQELPYQFEREGYFVIDGDASDQQAHALDETSPLIFNRTVTLRDSWAKAQSS